MKCIACGAPIQKGSLSCDYCGSGIKKDNEVSEETGRFDPIKSVIGTLNPDYGYKTDPNSIKPNVNKSENKKSTKILVVGAAIILLIILVF
jgi:hypothetical protein